MPTEKEVLRIDGREVTVSNPDKVYFPETGHTKLDLVRYYLAVADGALRGAGGRPMALKRFVNGAAGEPFFQKRAPENRPELVRTATLSFPSGRTADEIVIDDAAGLAWISEPRLHRPQPAPGPRRGPRPSRRAAGRPRPGARRAVGRRSAHVALVAREALEAVGLVGWPKTSGSRGIHINVRIEPRWTFPEVRRAALALARDVERRAPELATSKWWKEERHGVFLDYNQNAKDRTVASAYSVRPLPDARVSTPLTWDEVPTVEAEAFTIDDGPGAVRGDRRPGGRHRRGRRVARGAAGAVARATRRRGWATLRGRRTTRKQAGEPPRVQPSRAAPADVRVRHAGAAARRVDRRPMSPRNGRRLWQPATRTRACRPSGPARARRRPAGARRRSRSSRSRAPRSRTRRWPASSAGRRATPRSSAHLEPADILVDGMRGRSTVWYRVRVNLIHVPEADRPAQEPLDPDFDPWAGQDIEAWKAATAGSRARTPKPKSKPSKAEPPSVGAEDPG